MGRANATALRTTRTSIVLHQFAAMVEFITESFVSVQIISTGIDARIFGVSMVDTTRLISPKTVCVRSARVVGPVKRSTVALTTAD